MVERRRLLAGSLGPERVPARPDSDDTEWYLPLHLRDPQAARERLAAQVAAGVDVVVAPAWLTHRRALLPLGETRRARDWSDAAVRLAREAVEQGLERREAALTDAPEDDARHGRPSPLVAATLPALDEEVADGRLLPREAATARDYRDQAGHLADSEPDLILVEGQRSEADARLAITEALATGLPVWAALTPSSLAAAGLEGWLEWAGTVGLAQLLLPGPPAERTAAAGAPLPWGGLADAAAAAAAWLEVGAGTIAVLDGATLPLLERLREAIDEHERTVLEAARARERRWWRLVERAAAMAPGGAAVWLGPAPQRPLPDGFAWLVLDPSDSAQLPSDRFRLAVAGSAADVRAAVRTLERGGIVVGPLAVDGGLRLIAVDEADEPPLAIARSED